jgi:hypothetical protein
MSVTPVRSEPAWVKLAIPLALFITVITFSTVMLGIPSKWWYEDDPGLYWKVMRAADPLRIFLDPIHLRSFATGKALVPMQMLSYWLDMRLFGANVTLAYMHSMVSFALAIVMLYVVLYDWLKNQLIAIAGALLWMILPSSLAVHYFISARHYVEGLIFALLAIFLSMGYTRSAGQKAWHLLPMIVISSVCAMLFKEVYATTVPTFLFLLGIGRRRLMLSVIAVYLVVFYTGYRYWVLGADLTYTEQLLNFNQYMQFLSILPYTLASNYAGYAIYLGMLWFTIVLFAKNKETRAPIFLAILVFLSALVSIYAVSSAVLVTYLAPGTWYRVPMIVNSVMVLWGMYVLHHMLPHRYQLIAVIGIAILIMPGTYQTKRLWDERMDRAELEGRFYLAYPDRLLYSEEDAWWYIMGIHELYAVPNAHYVNKQSEKSEHTRQMVERYTTIWTYQDGAFEPNPTLFQTLQQANR